MNKLSNFYASALFDIALQKNVIDDFYAQALLILDALSDKDFLHILVHPQIPASEKQEIFKKAFSEQLHEDLLSFLFLTTDKNREANLVPALKSLIELIKKHNKIVTARVLSASAYDTNQAEALREILSKKLKKQVELDLKVDPSLIGGPYIFVDGYYIDWTVKKRLRDLTVYMKEGCGA